MKKNYITPTVEVVHLNTGYQLLAGSGQATSTSLGFGDDANDDDYGD